MSDSGDDDSDGGPFVDSDFPDSDDSDASSEQSSYEAPNRTTVDPDDIPRDSPGNVSKEPVESEDVGEGGDASEDAPPNSVSHDELPPNPTDIEWSDIVDDDPQMLNHILTRAASVEVEPMDCSVPTRRLLARPGKMPPNSTGFNFRLTETAERNTKDLENLADEVFDESITKSFVRDAIVRVAAQHPDEVIGMLAAYGFDQPFE